MGTSVRDFKIKLKKGGTFTAKIVLEKTNYIDITINNCEFEISKLTAPSLTFSKFEAYNNDKTNAIITEAKILEKVQGKKAGYTLKSISNISGANLAEVSGKTIRIKKEGTFTATIVLESDKYEDVKLTSCSFSYINVFNVVGEKLMGYNDNKYKTKFTTLNIPSVIDGKTITSIGNNAFRNNVSLTSITIPSSVTAIGGFAFYDCVALTSITIPNSVTSIESSAFASCVDLTSVTIPNSVTSIGVSAFRKNFSLTSITIPNSVTAIGGFAFYECKNLTVIIKQTDPAKTKLDKNTFIKIKELKVPSANLSAYKTAKVWSSYISIMKGY